jgi:hypothetical protein
MEKCFFYEFERTTSSPPAGESTPPGQDEKFVLRAYLAVKNNLKFIKNPGTNFPLLALRGGVIRLKVRKAGWGWLQTKHIIIQLF